MRLRGGGLPAAADDLGTADLGASDLGVADLGASDVGTADLGPPDFGPDQGPTCPPFAERPEVVLNGPIDADRELTCDEAFVLRGTVQVEAGATLTIGPGVVVLAEANALLAVEQGGRLVAEGTASAPVVFTSTQFIDGDGDPLPSFWQGIWLLGSAPVHGGLQTANTTNGEAFMYGGSAQFDSSGTLRYVRIEYASLIAIYAAGSGTTLESVQMLGSNGGLLVSGGSATLKRVLLDDVLGGLFWERGYTGLVQFLLIRDTVPSFAGFNCLTGFNWRFDEDILTPLSDPSLYNVTCVDDATDGAPSWILLNGTAGTIANSLVDSPRGDVVRIVGADTEANLFGSDPPLEVIDNLWWGFEGDVADTFGVMNEERVESTLVDGNTTDDDPMLPASALSDTPDFAPASPGPAVDTTLQVPDDEFFESAPYYGAIEPGTPVEDQWWFGWARFDPPQE